MAAEKPQEKMQRDVKRVDWDNYFMNIADQVATRSTCDRKHVGAVIVRNRTILSTGYNGSVRGAPHCDDVGHDMEHDHCVRTVHAEANAIAQGEHRQLGDIHNSLACLTCFKLAANSGIRAVHYMEFYRDERITVYANQAGIRLDYMGGRARK